MCYLIYVYLLLTIVPQRGWIQITQYNTIQYNTIQYNTKIQYNTIQYNTIQYNTIQIPYNGKYDSAEKTTTNKDK